MRPRDSQRQRLYDAEQGSLGAISKPLTFEGCVEYLRLVKSRPWYRTRWANGGAGVVVRSNGQGGRAGSGEIRLGEWARQEVVVLHELAHTLTPTYTCAAHGPEFAGVLLFLVRHQMGKAAGDALRAGYRANGVRYTMSAIPAPTRRDATVTAQRRQQVEARRQPLTDQERGTLVRLLDRAIQSGEIGAVGTTGRTRALALRRGLARSLPDAASLPPRRRRRGVAI